MLTIHDYTEKTYISFYKANIGDFFKTPYNSTSEFNIYLKIDSSHAYLFSSDPKPVKEFNPNRNILLVDAEINIKPHKE